MINLCIKFEIYTLTHYNDMKGDEKCDKFGGLLFSSSSVNAAQLCTSGID